MTAALVQGNCLPLVVRRAREIELTLFRDGWAVGRLSGVDPDGLAAAAAGSVFFGEARNAYIVREPELAPAAVAALVESADGDEDMLVIAVLEGRAKGAFSKKVLPLFNGVVETFDAPGKLWERDPWAASFAVQEAKRLGTPMEESLARALVSRVGSDPGTIIWEILKAHLAATATPLDALGASSESRGIVAEHIAAAIAPVAELGPGQLEDALAARSGRAILTAARRMSSRSSKDPTMWAVGVIAPTVIKWAAAAGGKGSVAGIPPYVWKNFVVPPARRWGIDGCVRILASMAEAEAAVKSGASSPWNLLICGLVSAAEGLDDPLR